MFPEGGETLEVALLARIDLIEKIAPQQQEVDLAFLGVVDDLCEAREGVLGTDCVLLLVA